ncbi:hypothetical protein HDU98_011312 [Podochytrium sp. JEL0797]|nr:hypothetical protein HDU98_011312 [Podochytrium sp. JEL0797]
MPRAPFQPGCYFSTQQRDSIVVRNDSSIEFEVSVTLDQQLTAFELVPIGGVLVSSRGNFEFVVFRSSFGDAAQAKLVCPGAEVRLGSDGFGRLARGLVLDDAKGPLNTLAVRNTSAQTIQVAIGSDNWADVAPGETKQWQKNSDALLGIKYFDAARVGLLMSPGHILTVGDHNDAWPRLPTPPLPNSLSFLSFNIRYGNANDLLNAWHYRRYMHRDVYAKRLPTVFGLQESFLFQRQQIAAALPWYQYVGVGREKDLGGEGTPVFYDARVFMLKFTETYWLSETPNVAGSVTPSWGNHLARIATVAHLVPNKFLLDTKSGMTSASPEFPEIVVVNVHLDHEAPIARLKSAQLVCKRTKQYLRDANVSPNALVVVMGDFNNEEFGSPENVAMEKEGGFWDALRSHGKEGTFHDFTGVPYGPRIDYIYVSESWKSRLVTSEIIKDNEDGWFPSDHLSVLAEFDVKSLALAVAAKGTVGARAGGLASVNIDAFRMTRKLGVVLLLLLAFALTLSLHTVKF